MRGQKRKLNILQFHVIIVGGVRKEHGVKPDKNNTLCNFPFAQIALKEWNKDLGIVTASPCCNSIRPSNNFDPLKFKNKLNGENVDEIFYSREMNELRESMLRGEKHSACDVCWNRENNENPDSFRLRSGLGFEVNFSEPKLQKIDVTFGEECNLRCRMCTPKLSNSLRKDYKFFHKNNLDVSGVEFFDFKDNRFLKDNSENEVYYWKSNGQWQSILSKLNELKSFMASGGEPLLSKSFLEVLDKAPSNIHIDFHSNCTLFSKSIIEKLSRFDKVTLRASIDSVYENYEYIRYPMKWKILEKNINKIRKLNNVKIDINCVLSVLNCFDLHKLFEYFNDDKINIFVDLLVPENKFINVKFLSKELKEKLIVEYSSYNSNRIKLNDAINFLKNDIDVQYNDSKNMMREILLFDKSRNQNYEKYLSKHLINFLNYG